ncbi:MAG: baseplate J/gp47 family protein [Endomicrobiia bacterium]
MEIFQADQLLNIAKNYLIATPPTSGIPWNLNPGSRIRSLLEAFCLIESMTANDYFLKLKNAIFKSVMESFKIEKLKGYKSSGKLVFTRSENVGLVIIPIGTRIIAKNGKIIETIEAGQINDGEFESLPINSQATETGEDGNFGIQELKSINGTCNFIDKVDGVENVYNSTIFSGGQNEETDDQQLARFRQIVKGLTTSTRDGLLGAVLSINGVKSADIIENYPERGINTIFVDDGTGGLSPLLKAEIEKVLNGDINDPVNYPGKRAAGIICQVKAPNIILIDIELIIYRLRIKSITDNTLVNLAKTAIENYLNTRRFAEDVILEAVDTAVMNCHPEVYDVKIINPVENVIITGYNLARAGNIIISIITREEP